MLQNRTKTSQKYLFFDALLASVKKLLDGFVIVDNIISLGVLGLILSKIKISKVLNAGDGKYLSPPVQINIQRQLSKVQFSLINDAQVVNLPVKYQSLGETSARIDSNDYNPVLAKELHHPKRNFKFEQTPT